LLFTDWTWGLDWLLYFLQVITTNNHSSHGSTWLTNCCSTQLNLFRLLCLQWVPGNSFQCCRFLGFCGQWLLSSPDSGCLTSQLVVTRSQSSKKGYWCCLRNVWLLWIPFKNHFTHRFPAMCCWVTSCNTGHFSAPGQLSYRVKAVCRLTGLSKLSYDWWSVCPGVRPPSGNCDQFFFSFPLKLSLQTVARFVIMGYPLWWERGLLFRIAAGYWHWIADWHSWSWS
jgi:hypothetical protein